MPNHVTTRCAVTGPRLATFKEKHIKPDERVIDGEPPLINAPAIFDLNSVIPMPDSVRATGSSSSVDFVLYAMGLGDRLGDPLTYQWVKDLGIKTRADFKAWIEKDHKDWIKEAEPNIRAYAETGYKSWYDWSIAQWGTKWNTYSFEILNDQPNYLEFSFKTAWNTPDPVFHKIAAMYPDLHWEIKSFDEGWNFGMQAFISDGQFMILSIEATPELYEEVYGEPPMKDDEI